tara:strand:+ start:295 stop:621 length:327 start_codon:yes stop_codon:yes gene_type:complete
VILILDHEGREHYRISGYLPPQEYMAHLSLGRGMAALSSQNYQDATKRYSEVVCHYQDSDAVPEVYYWIGVARYKKDGNPEGLIGEWKHLTEKHLQSIWAKKPSFVFE